MPRVLCPPDGVAMLLGFAVFLCNVATAPARGKSASIIPEEFSQLWNYVVVNQQSRGVPLEDVSAVRRVCQFGLGNSTFQVDRFLLSAVEPPIDVLEILDVDVALEAPREAAQLAGRLQVEFGDRVRHAVRDSSVRQKAAHLSGLGVREPCDLVIYSESSPRFSIERVVENAGTNVLVVWVSHHCVNEVGDQASPECNFLNTMWEQTSLMRRGYCLSSVCMSRVPKNILVDPNALPLDCEKFLGEDGSNASVSEFGQDWYLWWNFLRHRAGASSGEGVYVDVGASLPYDYSNTVILDRCLGWRGVCVEPNPHLVPFLEGYRGCEVVRNCAEAETERGRSFVDRDGTFAFAADCRPMRDILTSAGLRGQRIDVLSIDVEHGELRVLQGLALAEFDIRFIVAEVTHGARWLEVDTAILPHGYAKVAVLGRDVVYAKLEELSSGGFSDWPNLAVAPAVNPPGWEVFHQRVVDEELEEEMRREREAFYKGLRRR